MISRRLKIVLFSVVKSTSLSRPTPMPRTHRSQLLLHSSLSGSDSVRPYLTRPSSGSLRVLSIYPRGTYPSSPTHYTLLRPCYAPEIFRSVFISYYRLRRFSSVSSIRSSQTTLYDFSRGYVRIPTTPIR